MAFVRYEVNPADSLQLKRDSALWTLPTAIGSPGSALVDVAGDGVLSFVPVSGGSANYVGPYSGLPAAGNAGRLAFLNDGVVSLLDDGVSWRSQLDGVIGTLPPSIAGGGWTKIDTGGPASTESDDAGTIKLVQPVQVASIPLHALLVRSVPGVLTVETCVYSQNDASDSTVNSYPQAGVTMRRSSDGKRVDFSLVNNIGTGSTYRYGFWNLEVWNSNGARASGLSYYPLPLPPWSRIFMRLRLSGSTVAFEISVDRKDWLELTSIPSVFLSTPPDQAGVQVTSSTSWFPHFLTTT